MCVHAFSDPLIIDRSVADCTVLRVDHNTLSFNLTILSHRHFLTVKPVPAQSPYANSLDGEGGWSGKVWHIRNLPLHFTSRVIYNSFMKTPTFRSIRL